MDRVDMTSTGVIGSTLVIGLTLTVNQAVHGTHTVDVLRHDEVENLCERVLVSCIEYLRDESVHLLGNHRVKVFALITQLH